MYLGFKSARKWCFRLIQTNPSERVINATSIGPPTVPASSLAFRSIAVMLTSASAKSHTQPIDHSYLGSQTPLPKVDFRKDVCNVQIRQEALLR